MGAVHAREAVYNQTSQGSTSESSDISLNTIPVTVDKVHIDGVGRTKMDLLMSNVKPIFKVQHFEGLVIEANDIRSKLQDLGCFSDVEIHIDTSATGGSSDYEVTFKVQELGRITGSINTIIGNQEGSLLTGVKMPNMFGRGERFQVDYTHGTRKTNTFNASLIKPLHGRFRTNVSTSLFQQASEYPQSGLKVLNRGALIDFAFMSAPQISHNLQWEGVWRDLRAANRLAAFAVREQAGHSLKSALKHVFTVDRRDNSVFPVEGSLFRITQEFAGLGGNIKFFKNELELQANLPIINTDFVLQGGFHCGYLKNSTDNPGNMADLFYIGGPQDIRGFEMRGIGNQSDGCFMGGLAYWRSGLHLFAPLPFYLGRGGFGDLFRTHFFVTAGNMTNASTNLAEELSSNVRLSYGLGLAFKLGGVARIELNYCIPVRAVTGDKISPGVQFGIGVNFL